MVSQAGSGSMFLKGGLEVNDNAVFKVDKTTLQVGGMCGLKDDAVP